MTFVIMVMATLISAALYFKGNFDKSLKLNNLVLIYAGTAVMMLVDVIFAAAEEGAAWFTASIVDDALLGLLLVVVGVAVWGITVFCGRIKKVEAA